MGDPKFPRRKWAAPAHPWKTARIQEEHEIRKSYGLKNMREIWKAKYLLRGFRRQARALLASGESEQAQREKSQLLQRLVSLGIIPEGSNLDDILALKVDDILNRRLQTVVYHKGLSNTIREARKFIVHGHIAINGRRMTIPGYLVKKEEEEYITYTPTSPLANELHPARPRNIGEGPNEEEGEEPVNPPDEEGGE